MRKITGFLVLLSLTLYCMEMVCGFLFRKNTGVKSVFVQQGRIDADVLALGSSNVLYMFAPAVFEKETGCKAYNLATNHASFSENLALLHLYLLHNKAPRFLLIGINLPDMTLSGSAFHGYDFAPFMDEPVIHALVERNDPVYGRYSHIPCMKYAWYNELTNPILAQGLYKWLSGRGAFYPDGFYRVPDDGKEFRGYDTFKKEHPEGVECAWSNEQARQLDSLLDYASGKGIGVMVYETPFLGEAREFFRGSDVLNRKIERAMSSRGVKFCVFDTLSLCRDRANFVSAFHLKREQAEAFTKILGRKTEEISPSFCKEVR